MQQLIIWKITNKILNVQQQKKKYNLSMPGITGIITTDSADKRKKDNEEYSELYTHKLENLDEMSQVL